jgi:hypothetical protein
MHSAESRPEAKHRSRLRGRKADELEVGLKKLKIERKLIKLLIYFWLKLMCITLDRTLF